MKPQHPNSRGERAAQMATKPQDRDRPPPCHLVAAALGRLTQEHWDVLRECYFRGSSVAQAAHAIGIAPGTVKSRTYYALRALRLAIEELRDVE